MARGVIAQGLQQAREVVQACRSVRMLRAERLLTNRQRALTERPRPGEIALGPQQARKAVQGCRSLKKILWGKGRNALAKLGSRTPIVVTLDLHANVTRKMADNANALIAFRTYPHIDMYERAWQGAELLECAMRGKVRPVTVIARRPMLHGLDWGRTQRGPMAELIARGETLEAGGKGARRQHVRRLRTRQYP